MHALAPLGGAVVEAVVPFKSEVRDDAAHLIRRARACDDRDRAVAMRKAWKEKLLCAKDGELSGPEAEQAALEILNGMVAARQR